MMATEPAVSDEDRTAKFMQRIEEASAFPMGLKSRSSAGFDRAGEHVLTLLDDAVAAFERASFGTATFLALTALEETAKAELMLYRREPGEPPKRGDPLRSHANKHAIAVRDTTFMGRLPKLLGPERCEALHAQADAGQLVALREASLYVDAEDGELTPKEVVGSERAREILLVAIEAADDAPVGYTNQSMDVWSPVLDAMFDKIAAAD
jgi:AbiV family abortive infection protein